MRDESIKERVPDQPKPEESLDSREDITEFEPEKAVNKTSPLKGRTQPRRKTFVINRAYQEMKKRKSKPEKRQKKRKQEVCPCSLVFICFM